MPFHLTLIQLNRTPQDLGVRNASSFILESLRLDDVKVYFLPLNSAHDLCKKNKYQRRFDVVYLSNR